MRVKFAANGSKQIAGDITYLRQLVQGEIEFAKLYSLKSMYLWDHVLQIS